jgi:hypothetical protein
MATATLEGNGSAACTTTNGGAPSKPMNGGPAQQQLTGENSNDNNNNNNHDNAPLEREPLFAPEPQDPRFSSDSEQTTSPSVTSPPYWAVHHHGAHSRGASNVSVESVLPIGAITLQDNEHDDGPGGSNVYGRDRNRACWAKSVNITDYVMVNGSTTNIGAFIVWNIRVETLSVRFSNYPPFLWSGLYSFAKKKKEKKTYHVGKGSANQLLPPFFFSGFPGI